MSVALARRRRPGKLRAGTLRLGARLWILGGLAVLVVIIVPLLPETWWGVATGRGFGRLETVAKILTPLILLVGVLVAFRRIKAAEDQAAAALDQARAALRQAQTAEEGQITERFTRAVEHLGRSGDENLAIRLGGIYALERIAWDSERDHWPVMEILCTFLRESFPRQMPPETSSYLPADGQAVCTVLGRRAKRVEPEALNLRRANLRADLRRARLEGANLIGADLYATNLYAVNLRGAHLHNANLAASHLEDASLKEATLRGAHLEGANLDGADLTGADLENADLAGVGLWRADLRRAHLVAADLENAHLDGADLRRARLENANLESAHLGGANLTDADLDGANLERAIDLTQEQVDQAQGSSETRLPEELKHPEHWPNRRNRRRRRPPAEDSQNGGAPDVDGQAEEPSGG